MFISLDGLQGDRLSLAFIIFFFFHFSFTSLSVSHHGNVGICVIFRFSFVLNLPISLGYIGDFFLFSVGLRNGFWLGSFLFLTFSLCVYKKKDNGDTRFTIL